jgi:hypothetical protein
MEAAPENRKESPDFAPANGMNEGLFVTTIYETIEQVISR